MKQTLVGALIALGLILGLAGPAAAHAQLQSSDPADGAVLATAPTQVSITFDESVSVTDTSIRVFDSQGKRVDLGNTRTKAHDTIAVGLRSGLARGTYVVTWRVVSADSHPVHGGFEFSVGAKGKAATGVGGADSSDKPWQVTGAVLRIAMYLGLLLAVGGAVFLATMGADAERTRSRRLILVAAVVGVIAAVLQIPVEAALATGLGLGSITNPGVLGQVLGDNVGFATALILGACALSVFSSRRTGPDTVWLSGAAVLLTGTALAFVGHSRTITPLPVSYLADLVHAAAGAIWFGGVVLLLVTVQERRHLDDPSGAARAVARFSKVATIALVGVTTMGLVLTYLDVRSWSALFGTTYGRVLLAKVAAAAVVIAAGAFNHFRLVDAVGGPAPAPEGGDPDGDGDPDGAPATPTEKGTDAGTDSPTETKAGRVTTAEPTEAAWRRLTRALRIEVVGLVVVLGLTGVLVNVVPARTSVANNKVVSVTAPLGTGTVNLVVDPARANRPVSLHLYLLDAEGRPLSTVQDLALQLSLPEQGLGPLTRKPSVAGPGHYVLPGATFPLAGRWRVKVLARVDEFNELDATLIVPINP